MEKENEHDTDMNNYTDSEPDKGSSDQDNEEEEFETEKTEEEVESYVQKINELNDKYVRLYAEFDNFRKAKAKEKEDILKYGSESLLFELLTVLDTLELALQHAEEDDMANDGLKQGVEMTLKEFQRVVEKFGLKKIEAREKPFDPAVHEAMSQVVNDDIDEGIVVDEFRKGYAYYDKLLRPSLVAVSKKSDEGTGADDNAEESININIKEDSNG